MKEIRSILDLWKRYANDQPAVLATLVSLDGSSYRQLGARMLILENGEWIGGISGGCLEGNALKQAQKVLRDGKARLVEYDTRISEDRQIGIGLGCEGRIEVLFQSLKGNVVMIDLLKGLSTIRKPACVITVFKSSLPGDPWVGRFEYLHQLPENWQSLLKFPGNEGQSHTTIISLEDRDLSVLVEWVTPNIRMIIGGDNRDVYPLVNMSLELGWEVTLTGRSDKYRKDHLRHGVHIMSYEELERIPLDRYTAVIGMFHDYNLDRSILEWALSVNPGYTGLLGPRKRFDRMSHELKLSEEVRSRIHSPVGLDLGALTPEEIAVSIISGVIAHFRGGAGGALRKKDGPIHRRRGHTIN